MIQAYPPRPSLSSAFGRFTPVAFMLTLISLVTSMPAQTNEPAGTTRVAKWKDDRAAAFLLMFDDGWKGHVEVAIPALQKRKLTGTFYMVPKKNAYLAVLPQWEAAVEGGGVVYGNHTMTHQGVRDYEHARTEIVECTRIIREELQPIPGKPKRLVSFARPGVPKGQWTLSKEDLARVLKEDNMIERPPFKDHGAVYHLQELEEMTDLVDKAIASKGTEYLILHGVERIGATWQDFWPLKQEIFFPLLDCLKEKQDSHELWVTDHITWHQYKTQRDAAKIKILKADEAGIELEFTSQVDPELYDLPLTLITNIPAHWKECQVVQGEFRSRVTAVDGTLTYDVLPNGPSITISPATL